MRHSDKAMVFDIQHASFVDGPGIRTTVFFKGCNLRCRWCHNPEGIDPEKQLMIYRDKCTGCGRCAAVCKHKPCILCGRCADVCPNEARKLCGQERSLDELFAEIIKDKAFYDASGGGLTCSGGECMLRADFLSALLKKCKEADVSTAVDTAGNVAWESFESVAPYTDLFLYDIKCVSPDLHRQGTGVDNARILDNYRRLIRRAKVCVRVPVIGGFNDEMRELEKIGVFLRDHPPESVELLPYHAMGEHKYGALGKSCEKFSVPSGEFMQEARKAVCGG